MNITQLIEHILLEEKKKADRCKRIADRKYDKPSAYKSGAIVRCRQGKIWKGLKENLDPDTFEDTGLAGKYGSGYARLKEIIQRKLKEKETLRTWFKRKGAPGKVGGWVDCNTCRDGKCKPCGIKKGEVRSKYPSCRPTPSQCKRPGKGKTWGKTK